MAVSERRGVAIGAFAALVIAALVLSLALLTSPFAMPRVATYADRLAFALKCDLFVLLWLVLAVGRVGMGRFFSPEDIRGAAFGPPSARLALPAAILQNTLEQVVLAIFTHLILAILLRGDEMLLIPLMVILFCLGRLAFWALYARGPGARAVGFGLTFYPTIFGFVLAIVLLLVRG